MPQFASTRSDPETGQGGKPNVHYTVGAAGLSWRWTGDREGHVARSRWPSTPARRSTPAVEGQITGGVLQGLATVLYEDMRFDDRRRLLNPNLHRLQDPDRARHPRRDDPDPRRGAPSPTGRSGRAGVGEHTMIPAAPMVANAIEDAVGIRITSMPITAEKVALTLAEAREEKRR
jgi:hypothetical protein